MVTVVDSNCAAGPNMAAPFSQQMLVTLLDGEGISVLLSGNL